MYEPIGLLIQVLKNLFVQKAAMAKRDTSSQAQKKVGTLCSSLLLTPRGSLGGIFTRAGVAGRAARLICLYGETRKD